MRLEWQAGQFGDLFGGAFGEFRMSVQPCAHRGAADGEIVKPFGGHLEALDVALQKACPAGKLLPHGERSGVLQVGAANLHNILKFLCFGVNCIMYFFNCRNEPLHGRRRRNVHGCREGVVGRLRHIHVVVGVYGIFRAEDSARDFNGAIGDDLVHVHVGLGAAASLPDTQRELFVQFALDDFVRRLDNQFCLVGWQLPQILVHQGCRFFENAEGADQLRRHGVAADVEMKQGTLGLRSPINVSRNLDFAHAVGFDSGRIFRSYCYGKLLFALYDSCSNIYL